MHHNNVTAVILAGGKGRRMGGIDKGLMILNGRAMIEHIILAIKPQCQKIIINANRNIDQYERYPYPVISDNMGDFQGPLAGFASALNVVNSAFIITLPCDAPKLPGDYVVRMLTALNKANSAIAVVNDGHRMQPVYALIKTSLEDNLLTFLKNGGRKIDRWYAQNNVTQVDFSDCQSHFLNINTPEQKQQLQQGL